MNKNGESSPLLVRDVGEQGVLEQLQRFCPPDVIGDDAAVIPSPTPGQSLVVTTDVLVDQVHFSDRTTSPEDIGWRATAANLSDLAAMGASPLGITIGLSLTGDIPLSWVEQLYQGVSQCLQPYNTPIVGGDVCRSPVISISITAFGQVFPHRTIRRSTARVGDAIIVTGVHGASRAGLELLLNPEWGEKLSEAERIDLIRTHQRPQPRLNVLPLLWTISDTHPQFPIAGMDSSDGLADAVVQICRGSGVGAQLERTQIPQPPILSRILSPEKALDWTLYGGEDFELVLCLPDELAKVLVEQLGEGAAVIGHITTGQDVWLKDSTGTYRDELLTFNRGFQHF
ncbi:MULTISPECIES: thiamine-phosphate kinase [unclassified Coleofasciculus]|uniref:thiamine-phosphate kinase n=1 Tax=unclassified Coleofasciculus TaxID=2692782 RepID=UPI001882DA9B|nr:MULTISPECIES: thiamine-phosphate kinase [unclassified Coleofasciculus]MBE9129785.1 thiamine-phosphate kinase [Coleofasciculus sp. LEGE 07081]MBE9152245.1 thiamine-phosphate kinase [Coleofasciculus sp. LEGE 07092]